jgi:hypothetical protein
MKSAQSPHSGRRAGQAPDVTGISTLVIVLLLALAHLAAGPLPTAAEAAPAAPTWSSRITPLPGGPGFVPRSMKLFYQASWSRWLAAGSVQMSFSSRGGRIEATSETRSKGAVRAIWPYESTTRSRISPATLIPSHMEHVQTERSVRAEYEADYRNGVMRVDSIIEPGGGAAPVRETQTYRLPDIRDLHSALLFLQRADLRPNRSIVLLVQPVDSLYLVSFDVAGRESRKVLSTQWDTIKLNVRIRKVMDDLRLAPFTRMRSASLWLSDDDDRIPLEIEADVFIGFVSVRLVGRSIH